MQEFLKGWSLNIAVLHALLIRETRTRFGKRQLGYLWALIEPMIWVLSFQIIFTVLDRKPAYEMPVAAFILTGIVPFTMLRNVVGKVMSAVQSNKALLYYPQVHIVDLCIGRVILELLTMFAVLMVLWGGYALVGELMYIEDLLGVMVGFAQAALLGLGIGMLGLVLGEFTQTASLVIMTMFRPLFFVSGVFYPIESLPPAAQEVLLYNPILHIIQHIRDAWSPSYHSEVVNSGYVWAWCLITLTIGLHYLRSTVRQRVEFS